MKRTIGLFLTIATVAAACSSSGMEVDESALDSTASMPADTVEPTEPNADADSTDDAAVTESTLESSATTVVPAEQQSDDRYAAQIRRDSAGVPHITADDLGSLGFGQGWALADDRACTLIDQVVKVRGERSMWFGRGEDDRHVNSDFAYRHLGLRADAATKWADLPAEQLDLMEGYAAGVNAWLEAEGDNGLTWCAGEPWVAPIERDDLLAFVNDLLILASSRNFIDEIATAQPPTVDTNGEAGADAAPEPAEASALRLDAADFSGPGASNGWAFGSERSAGSGGMLLGNSHFPWEGELRFYETHLTVPGDLDVYGQTLVGLPGVQQGFNRNIAWMSTVSAGHRFTAYTYDLVEGDPTSYFVDGEQRSMTSNEITIDVLGDDGTMTAEVRTLWSTHHGPVVNVDPLGWSDATAIAIRDANIDLTTTVSQYLAMNRATTMDEFEQSFADHQGIPWVNILAASDDGRAYIIDSSTTPNLSPNAIAAWDAERIAGGFAGIAYDEFGLVLLDGSDSLFDWIEVPGTPVPGIVPPDRIPALERADYVFNANDSHWFSNPDELLTGYSPMHGLEETPRSVRTRTNAMLVAESTPDWTALDMQDAIFSNRAFPEEQLRSALISTCRATPSVDLDRDGDPLTVDLTEACDVLESWNGRSDIEQVGAIVWREFITRYVQDDRDTAGTLYSEEFDIVRPGETPAGAIDDRGPWLIELAEAVVFLEQLGIPIDAPLGDWQFDIRSGDRIPIHGGIGEEGLANVMDCRTGESSTMQELPDPGIRPEPRLSYLYDLPGYPICRGASFLFTVEWDSDGPVAEGFLLYGNPEDPADPNHSADIRRFSERDWRAFRFTDDEIEADADLETITVTGG